MLQRALDSVRDQTIGEVQTHVVIGLGLTEAYNVALTVNTDFVTWLDDDDMLYPDALENLLKAQRDSDADVVYGRQRLINPQGDTAIIGGFHDPERLVTDCFIPNGYMYRTSTFKGIGGFQRDGWHDVALHGRAHRNGATFKFVDVVLQLCTIHDDNLMRRADVYQL